MTRLDFKMDFKNKTAKNFMEIKNLDNGITELFIYGDICSSNWDKVSNEDICPSDIQDFLKDLDNTKELKIYINSGGGSVYGGLSIYNQLKRLDCKKTVYIDGIAGSIASVIAMVGEQIIMPKNTQMMIHKPLLGLCGFYNADDFEKLINTLDTCQNSILQVYKENLNENVEIETLEQMLNSETYLNAEECVKYFKNVIVQNTKEEVFINNKVTNLIEKEKLLLEIECI